MSGMFAKHVIAPIVIFVQACFHGLHFIYICSGQRLVSNLYAIFAFHAAFVQNRFTSIYPLFGREKRGRTRLVKKEESVPVSDRLEGNVAQRAWSADQSNLGADS